MEQEGNKALPEQFEKLKAAAGRTSSWRERLSTVEELANHPHPKVIGLLTYRMKNDVVYKVREAAYFSLKKLGQEVTPPEPHKGDLIDGLMKTLVRIKKSLPEGHSYEDFKTKLKGMRIDLYDAYEGEKGEEFDSWLEATWKEVRTR
ncbi:HEAT repeat domain-containing protein [Gorillibacterium sp. CAU 1737]|uniref:HEAT repeat domain-containing protein n=1 Tax=Gorillibacterium sp. CAU 1737 TaxID=3140362 RepID=UPI003260EC00